MTDPDVTDNPSMHRYELRQDAQLAGHAEYNLLQGAVLSTHTEVAPAFEGRGIGSRLARAALDDVRARGLHAIPQCQFIAGYIRKHPEYLDLVRDEHRRAYRL